MDSTILVDVIAGARPNFIKIGPIIRAIEARRMLGGRLRYRLVHTGQHYDAAMSGSFFDQLGIPAPDANLEAGPGTQAEQTAAIMTRYEVLLTREPSRACIVVGDVNSTMACAITAQKLHIPVGHVEGGLRSRDWKMPEEINRLVTDAISNWFFTTSEAAGENLRKEGVDGSRIFFVGNTMIDTLLAHMDRLRPPAFWDELSLSPCNYLVLTLHRPGNVDSSVNLGRMVEEIAGNADGLPVIFPVHPRTRAKLAELASLPLSLRPVEPQPYLEFNWLVKNARAVVTDSGGITEEATVLGVPCLTMRDTTERPETVAIGTNELIGTDGVNLKPALRRLLDGGWKRGGIPEKWDGRSAARIVSVLEKVLET